MEKTAQLLPITVLESPFDQPIFDPKDNAKKVIGVPVGIVPEGVKLVSLKEFFDEYRRKPAQREGSIVLHSFDGFVDFVNRYKHPKETVVFHQDLRKGVLVTAIFDYHPEGPTLTDTGAGKFRASFQAKHGDAISELKRRIAVPFFWGVAP